MYFFSCYICLFMFYWINEWNRLCRWWLGVWGERTQAVRLMSSFAYFNRRAHRSKSATPISGPAFFALNSICYLYIALQFPRYLLTSFSSSSFYYYFFFSFLFNFTSNWNVFDFKNFDFTFHFIITIKLLIILAFQKLGGFMPLYMTISFYILTLTPPLIHTFTHPIIYLILNTIENKEKSFWRRINWNVSISTWILSFFGGKPISIITLNQEVQVKFGPTWPSSILMRPRTLTVE